MSTIFTKKNLILLAILWLITNLFFYFGPWSITTLAKVSGGKSIPDLMISYDLSTLQDLFKAYGPTGISIYKNLQIIDFIYPIIYASLLFGFLVRVQTYAKYKFFQSAPFLIVFFDYSENFILRYLASIYPNLTETQEHLVNLASICTLLKWFNIGATIFVIIIYWLWNILPKKAPQ